MCLAVPAFGDIPKSRKGSYRDRRQTGKCRTPGMPSGRVTASEATNRTVIHVPAHGTPRFDVWKCIGLSFPSYAYTPWSGRMRNLSAGFSFRPAKIGTQRPPSESEIRRVVRKASQLSNELPGKDVRPRWNAREMSLIYWQFLWI